jgi:hypothetical protein
MKKETPARRPKEKGRDYTQGKPPTPLLLNTHRDLVSNIREICLRLNEMPDLARMLLVNPVLAFEDAGVQMTPEIREHIVQAIRFPPALQEKLDQLELDLHDELKALGLSYRLPLTAEQRSHVLFNVLKLEPIDTAAKDSTSGISSREARALRKQHPLAAKLVEYERARQGRLIFYPREVYETYKSGLKRHHWIKSVKFRV